MGHADPAWSVGLEIITSRLVRRLFMPSGVSRPEPGCAHHLSFGSSMGEALDEMSHERKAARADNISFFSIL